MQISAVEAIPVAVPKDRPSSSSLGTFESAKAGILRVRTDQGILHRRLEELCRFGYHTNPVRAAFDMAFYDILGKALGTPVYALLGGKARDRIELSMSVHMAPFAEMLAQTAQFIEAGYRTVKVKVGVDPRADLEIVRGIRNRFGEDLQIRVDANMGWRSPKEALDMIRRLNEYRILSVE